VHHNNNLTIVLVLVNGALKHRGILALLGAHQEATALVADVDARLVPERLVHVVSVSVLNWLEALHQVRLVVHVDVAGRRAGDAIVVVVDG